MQLATSPTTGSEFEVRNFGYGFGKPFTPRVGPGRAIRQPHRYHHRLISRTSPTIAVIILRHYHPISHHMGIRIDNLGKRNLALHDGEETIPLGSMEITKLGSLEIGRVIARGEEGGESAVRGSAAVGDSVVPGSVGERCTTATSPRNTPARGQDIEDFRSPPPLPPPPGPLHDQGFSPDYPYMPYLPPGVYPPSHLVHAVPPPVTLPTFPLDPLRMALLGQVEYYFGLDNMARDTSSGTGK